MKKRNHIESAMRNHALVINVVAVLFLFGIYALFVMNKDEFPQVTIRTGVVAAIYPGSTAEEVENQVTKPLEDYLFSFKDIDNDATYSYSRDGIAFIFPTLKGTVDDKDAAWAKVRGGLSLMKQTQLPQGVVAVAIIDDFGNTSSMLLAIESDTHSPRELESYAQQLNDRLRTIPQTGSVKILGTRNEEIAITLDVDHLSQYAIDKKLIAAQLAAQGFRTITGSIDGAEGHSLIHVESPINSVYDVGEMIVFNDPVVGQAVRLKDVATIEHRYEKLDKFIAYYDTTGSHSCVMLNIEMAPGNNIVSYGKAIDKAIDQVRETIPSDVNFHKITNQPRVVDQSVRSFLKDLFLSILVVILVMMILFPLRTAMVASTSVPICTAVSFGIMFLFGIELNTVTLAAMIVVLGMIVDDSVIVIDGYTDLLNKGYSRWYCAAQSTRQLLVPMILATTSISGMFFPMLKLLSGDFGDFVKLFPWTILIALTCSIFFAIWVIPFLAFLFIKPQKKIQMSPLEKVQKIFFDALQNGYTKLLDLCFRHPFATFATSIGFVLLGVFLFFCLDIQLLPKADRDAFAVEIHLTDGSTVEETAAISDSLAKVLKNDPRVCDVTSFVGMASPRFHAVYAPQIGGPSYGQFIVNTVSNDATVELVEEYSALYKDAFPNAYIRFKQIDYQAVNNPIEVNVQGSDRAMLEIVADSVKRFMATMNNLSWVHATNDEAAKTIRVTLREEQASQLGITQSGLSLYLNGALSKQGLSSIWDGEYKTPIRIYSLGAEDVDCDNIGDLLVPCLTPGTWVPLRQVADIEPYFHAADIKRSNGIPTITVAADVNGSASAIRLINPIKKYVRENIEPIYGSQVTVDYGGIDKIQRLVMPDLILTVIAALVILLALLLYHFKKVTISLLALSVSALCIFGSCLGLVIFDLPFTITAVLGLISLIGIIVRNAIIMYEYADSLVYEKHMTSREAAYLAGQRRMRPIFLTSCTTALGVIPMIIAHTSLWMPMGVVICFGTLFTLPMTITILPIAFWKVFERDTQRFALRQKTFNRFEEGLERREQLIEAYNIKKENHE